MTIQRGSSLFLRVELGCTFSTLICTPTTKRLHASSSVNGAAVCEGSSDMNSSPNENGTPSCGAVVVLAEGTYSNQSFFKAGNVPELLTRLSFSTLYWPQVLALSQWKT